MFPVWPMFPCSLFCLWTVAFSIGKRDGMSRRESAGLKHLSYGKLQFSPFQVSIEISKGKGYSPQTDPLLQLNSGLTFVLPGWERANLLSFRLSWHQEKPQRSKGEEELSPIRGQVRRGLDTCWERGIRAGRVAPGRGAWWTEGRKEGMV